MVKIRIWDLQENEYITPKDFINFLWGAKHTPTELILDDNVQEGYKVLRFTGLQDKGGRDIYEGDILKDKEDLKYTVEFRNGAFLRWGYGRGWDLIDSLLEKEILVVGNIYENPDLS